MLAPEDPRTPAEAAEAARAHLQAERAAIEVERTRQFLIAQTTLLGIAFAAVLGSFAAGMLEPLVLTASLTFCAVMMVVSAAGWWWYGRTRNHQPLIMGLLYVDSLLSLLFFYVAGEFETPALGMMGFIIVMAPIFVGKRHAWALAAVQLLIFNALLAIRHFGWLSEVLPYGSMLPIEALRQPAFVFDVALSFVIVVFGFAYLAGRTSIDILTSQDQLEREVTSKTHALAETGAALKTANADLGDANHNLNRANELLRISHGRLEQFNAAVSHDLKLPLQMVMSRAEMVTLTRDPEAAHRLAEAIVDTAERMSRQIDELFKLSHVGDRLGALEPVDLNEIVGRASEAVAPRLVAYGGVLEVASRLPCALGNAALLQELFQNLLENAAKYGGREGRGPRIRVEAVKRVDTWAVVAVEDDGPGVPIEERDRIFSLFKRMSAHEAVEGVGAGLAIVRRIAEVHGGEIIVEDGATLGGARFVLTLVGCGTRAAGRHATPGG